MSESPSSNTLSAPSVSPTVFDSDKTLKYFKFDKLDETNYSAWSIRFLSALEDAGLSNVIKEEGEDASKEKEKFVLGRMKNLVGDIDLLRIAKCGTPRAAWEKLKEQHEVGRATGRLMVTQNLADLRMEEGGSVMEHIEKFERIVARGRELGMAKFEEGGEEVALQFLSSLPPSLDSFKDSVTLLSAGRKDSLTLDSVINGLCLHARTRSSLASRPTLETALKALSASIRCYACNKMGHYASKCPEKKGEGRSRKTHGRYRERRKSIVSSEEEEEVAHSATVKGWGFSLYSESKSETWSDTAFASADSSPKPSSSTLWIVDSGCSNHITNDQSHLINVRSFNVEVQVANGKSIRTKLIGDLPVSTLVGGKEIRLTLSDVYYIPGFTKLLSIGQLAKKGVEVQFGSKCQLKLNGEVVMEGETYLKNLWRVDLKPAQVARKEGRRETEMAMAVDHRLVVKTLHRRLGHPSTSVM